MKKLLLFILIVIGIDAYSQTTYYTYKGQSNFTHNEGNSSSFNVSKGGYYEGKLFSKCSTGEVINDARTYHSCGSITGTISSIDKTVNSSSTGTKLYYQQREVPGYDRANQSVTTDNSSCGFRDQMIRTYSGNCNKRVYPSSSVSSNVDFKVVTLDFSGKGTFAYCAKNYPSGINLKQSGYWNRTSLPNNYGNMYFTSPSSAAQNAIQSNNYLDIRSLSTGTYVIRGHLPFWKGTATSTITISVENPNSPNAGGNVDTVEGSTVNLFSGAGTSSGSWSVSSGSLSGSNLTKSGVSGAYDDVTATLTIGSSCTASDSKNIRFWNKPSSSGPAWSQVYNREVCYNDGDFSISKYSDSVFETVLHYKKNSSGNWTSFNGTIDVSVLGTGTHSILYRIRNKQYTSASVYKTFTIEIVPQTSLSWSQSFPELCTTSSNINLTNYISLSGSSTFSCTTKASAVSGTTFYPSNAGQGSFNIRVTRDVNGCPKTINRTITVSAPQSIMNFNDITQCSGDPHVNLHSGSGYTWSGNGIGKTASGQWYWDPSSTQNNNTNILTAYLGKGTPCEVSTTRTAFRNPGPTMNIGNPTLIHFVYDEDGNHIPKFDLSEFNVSPSGGGTWSTGTSSYEPRLNNTDYTINMAEIVDGEGNITNSKIDGHYELSLKYSYTDGSGCSNNVNGNLQIRGLSASKFIVNDAIRCNDGALTFSGSWNTNISQWWQNMYEEYEVVWLDENDNVLSVGESFTTPTLTNSKTYYYSLRDKTLNKLTNRIPIEAIINPVPDPNIGDDVVVCDAVSGSYDLKTDEPIEQSEGVWTSNDIAVNNGIVNASDLNGVNPVRVTYTYTDENGCTGDNEKLVYFGAQETAYAGSDQVVSLVNEGELINSYDLNYLAKTPSGGYYSTKHELLNDQISENDIVDVSNLPFGINEISFTYNVISSNGCNITDDVIIKFHKIGNNPDFLSAENGSSCGNGKVDLAASTPTDYSLRWYETNTSTTVLSTGNSFTTASLTQNKVYYVALHDEVNDFEGLRKPVEAIINPLPIINVPTSDVVLCGAFGDTDLKDYVSSDISGVFSGDNISEEGVFYASEDSIGDKELFNINYSVKDNGGCENSKSFNVRIVKSTNSINAGSDIMACLGDNIIPLSGTPAPGTWSSGNEAVNQAIDNSRLEIDATNIEVGEYYLRYRHQTSSGCVLVDSLKLTINDLPVVPEFENVNLCESGTANLIVNVKEGLTYEWFNSIDGQIPFHTGSRYETQTLNSDRIYYVRSVNANGCSSPKQELRVKINEKPSVDVGDDLFFCDQAIELNLREYESPSGGYWEGPGVINDSTFNGNNLQTGKHTIYYYYINSSGCTNSDQMVISLGATPDISVSDSTVEEGDYISFELGTEVKISTITWDFGDGSTSNSKKPSHYFYNEGTYTIQVSVELENGCIGVYTYTNLVTVEGGNSIITGNDKYDLENVNVYPNPVKTHIKSSFSINGKARIRLFNSVGKVVYSKTFNSVKKDDILIGKLAFDGLNSGYYMLSINTDNDIKNIKIIKQ